MRIDSSLHSAVLLPSYVIDTFGLPGDLSRELWREVVDGTFELEGLTDTDHAHRVKTQVWFLDELLIARFTGETNVVHRTRKLVEHGSAPVLKVRVYRAGHSLLIDGDTQTTMGTGAIHFIDHDRPGRQVSSDHEQFTICVPHHAVGYDPAIHPPCFSISLGTARGRMIWSGFSALCDDIGTVLASEAPALSSTVIGLIRGSLAGSLDSQNEDAVHRSRVSAFKRYVDQHLADANLGMETLRREFGASRTTVYRDFAEVGGLQHYILERRLQHAYRLLAEASPKRGHVQDVALRCGFTSLAHFSRRFRESFAVAPSDVLGRWVGVEASPAGVRPRALTDATTDIFGQISALKWAYQRFRRS
jgi:AraC-like DNA-binding protein